MIVPEVAARNDYVGDTSTTQFPYSFAITEEEHIEVLLAGVVLVLNSNYLFLFSFHTYNAIGPYCQQNYEAQKTPNFF